MVKKKSSKMGKIKGRKYLHIWLFFFFIKFTFFFPFVIFILLLFFYFILLIASFQYFDSLLLNVTFIHNSMSGSVSEHQQRDQFETAEQKLRSLEKLEDTGVGQSWNWFTIRTILTSGAGFFTDSYDVFIINLVTPMLGYVYYSHNGNKMPADIEGVVKGMASVGTFIGQLLFGFMGDIFGRKIYGFELLIIIIGTINCATSASTVKGVSAIGFLGLWRLILGIGIGGDYR